uniref:Uncharacterized protein n=1 Tax=Pyxicephalus adspersus TaxID=30357 RepID=A0AAV2ZR54_PYXAD|nr:TPA: hypothetical protein GDO54_003847 [Pyxicephalus adspersus]
MHILVSIPLMNLHEVLAWRSNKEEEGGKKENNGAQIGTEQIMKCIALKEKPCGGIWGVLLIYTHTKYDIFNLLLAWRITASINRSQGRPRGNVSPCIQQNTTRCLTTQG